MNPTISNSTSTSVSLDQRPPVAPQRTGAPQLQVLDASGVTNRMHGASLNRGGMPSVSSALQAIELSIASMNSASSTTNAPVSGEPGKVAEAARQIMQKLGNVGSLSHKDYEGLSKDLRALRKSVNDSPELKHNPELTKIVNLTTQTLLFSLLTKATTDCRGTDSMAKDVGNGCLQVAAADNPQDMKQASASFDHSVSATKGFKGLGGDYGKNVSKALGTLHANIEAKNTLLPEVERQCNLLPQVMAKIEELSQFDIAAINLPLPTRFSLNVTEVYNALTKLQGKCTQEANPSIPFADLFLQTTNDRLGAAKTTLDVRSAEAAMLLCEAARTLRANIEGITPDSRNLLDLEELGDRLVDFIGVADKVLLTSDLDMLAQELSLTLQSIDLGELLTEGNLLCRQHVKSLSDFQEDVARFTEQAVTFINKPTCTEEQADAIRLFLTALNSRVSDFQKEERGNLQKFFEVVDQVLLDANAALHSGDHVKAKELSDQVLRQASDIKHRAENSLTAEAKASLTEGLGNIVSQAHLIVLMADLNERSTVRVDGNSMQLLLEQVENSTEMSPQDKTLLKNAIMNRSVDFKERLEQQLVAITQEYKQVGGAENIRHMKADLQSLLLQAARTLTNGDMQTFTKSVDRAQQGVAGMLLQLVRNDNKCPQLNKLIDGFSPNQQRVFQQLCVNTWSDPIFLQRLEKVAEDTGMQGLGGILTLLDKAWQGTPSVAKGQDAVAMLEKMLLMHPELDILSLELEKTCLPESEHALLIQKHGTERGKRALGAIFAKERGIDEPVSDAFLQLAVQNLGGKKSHSFDMQLLSIYWSSILVSEGVSGAPSPERFAAFQAGLPDPYKDMDPTLLSALMGSGLSGTTNVHSVVNVLTSSSKSLGTSGRVREIFQKICHHADRYNAEKIMTILSRNLLDAHSVTGAQAMEVGGALRNALLKELERDATSKEQLVDRARNAFRKEPVLTGTFNEQMAKVVQQFPEIKNDIKIMLDRSAILDVSESILANSMKGHAKNLVGVSQKNAIIPGDGAESIPLVNPDKIKGEQMCVGLLVLNDMLNNASLYGNTWKEQLLSMGSLNFQKLFSVEEMRGYGWGETTEAAGSELRSAVMALLSSTSELDFIASKNTIQAVFAMHSLVSKAEAILFFKNQGNTGGSDTLQRALTHKHHFTPDGVCVQRMQRKYATLRGAGARTAQAMSLSTAARAENRKSIGNAIDTSLHATSTHIAQTLNTAVHLAVLDTFSKTSCTSFEAFLTQASGDLENAVLSQRSVHFSDTLETLKNKLGIPEDLAEMALISFFKNAKADFVKRLAADAGYGFMTNLQRMALSAGVHNDVKSLMEEDRAHKAALHLMSKLGNNQMAALNLETGLTISVSAAKNFGLDFRATVDVARQNGMCAWRDENGIPCLTISKDVTGALGGSVDGLIGTIAAKASIQAQKIEDIKLTFSSDDAFANFMGKFFAGKSSIDSLAYCNQMAYSSGFGTGMTGILSTVDMTNFVGLVAGVAEFNFEAKAACSKIWTEKKEGSTHTINDAFKYDLSMNAQLAMLGKNYVQLVLDPAVDIVGNQTNMSWETRDKVHKAIERTGLKMIHGLTITKESSKTFEAGKLAGAETIRSCTLGTANPQEEASVALTSFGVDNAVVGDVLQGIGVLKDEGAKCSLEINWKLTDNALKQYLLSSDRGQQDVIIASPESFKLSSITVHGTKNVAEDNTWLGGFGQAFIRNANGSLNKDLVFVPSLEKR